MIHIDGISKSFGKGGSIHAVREVSFAAPDGQITGLLGPNGAGKTTLLRMLATLIVPDQGSASIGGLVASVVARIGRSPRCAAPCSGP